MSEQEMCEMCEKNPAMPEHTCPYKHEFGSGEECNCCDDCRGDCWGDI
jgi:hypothetical protein